MTLHWLECPRFLVFFLLILAFSACDKDEKYDQAKAVSAFAIVDVIKIDPELEKVEVKLPKQQLNDFWSGSSSESNQRIENFAFPNPTFGGDCSVGAVLESSCMSKYTPVLHFDPPSNPSLKAGLEKSLSKKSSPAWSFYSGSLADHFTFSPIIKNDQAFILDTSGELRAIDLRTENQIWKSQIFEKKFLKNYRTPKIGYSTGKIFATAGINRIVAANESDGKILWARDISSIPVSAPISDGNLVYITSNDNKLYALAASDGELQWFHSGISRSTAIFGAADPVIFKNSLIVSYSSGEIYALDKKTGEPLWSQNLNLSKATNSDFYLNDIDATPLAKDGVIYSIGNGGWMMAIAAKTGDYLWKKEIAGITDFWLAGEFLFTINNDNKLLAIHKKTGGVKWISQLPNFEKEKKPETKIIYSGVIMAGDKLLISSTRGEILTVSPFDGKIEKIFDVGQKIFHSPIVVEDKIYLHSIGKFTINLFEIQ
jgi:outer membrane protein assembly factor BamB